jgi:transposase
MAMILAIDMGKNKSVYCRYESTDGKHSYGRIPTTPRDFHDLLVEHPQDTVVIEVGPLCGWVSDLCGAMGVKLLVVNTASEAWSWKKVKDKSDRKDALKIAVMQAMGQHRYVHVPCCEVRQWRELIAYRDNQVGRVTACKNRIRGILDRQGERWPSGSSGWTEAALKGLRSEARPLEECDGKDLWRGMLHQEVSALEQAIERLAKVTARLDQMAEGSERVKRLRTIPGVGRRTAEVAVAMLDDSSRFKNVSQVGAYTGLTPRRCQSGQMDRQLGISYAGSRVLRKMLVQASWIGQQTNPWMVETFERLSGGKPGRRKKAIVGVARKLFVRMWAMDRDGKDWSGPAAVKPIRRAARTAGPVIEVEDQEA